MKILEFEVNSLEIHRDFVLLADSLCELLASVGISMQSYCPGLPLFSKLTEEQKTQAVKNLRFFYELCTEQKSEGFSLKDNPSFTWRALRKLGYVPPSDLFDQIKQDHVVEIYTSEGLQVYRNFNYFEYCSYSFEEIHSLEWWRLYQRPELMTEMAFAAVGRALSTDCSAPFVPDIPCHIVKETCSSMNYAIEYRIDLMSPLFRNKRAQAVLMLEKARILSCEDL